MGRFSSDIRTVLRAPTSITGGSPPWPSSRSAAGPGYYITRVGLVFYVLAMLVRTFVPAV